MALDESGQALTLVCQRSKGRSRHYVGGIMCCVVRLVIESNWLSSQINRNETIAKT